MAAMVSAGRNRQTKKFHTVSLNICQHNDSTTLLNLCLHCKFVLDRRCQFSSQILVICGKFWFSAFISRHPQLRLIECSQVFTVRLFLVKKNVSWVISTLQERWFWSIRRSPQKMRRFNEMVSDKKRCDKNLFA